MLSFAFDSPWEAVTHKGESTPVQIRSQRSARPGLIPSRPKEPKRRCSAMWISGPGCGRHVHPGILLKGLDISSKVAAAPKFAWKPTMRKLVAQRSHHHIIGRDHLSYSPFPFPLRDDSPSSACPGKRSAPWTSRHLQERSRNEETMNLPKCTDSCLRSGVVTFVYEACLNSPASLEGQGHAWEA